MKNNSSKYNQSILFHFLSFMLFCFFGILSTYKEVTALGQALASGSIDELSFEFIKHDYGTVSYGYAALLQHIAMLLFGILMFALAMNSLRKIIALVKN